MRVLLAGGGQAALDCALRDEDLGPRDRAFLTQLVYGTLKMRRSLDWALARVSSRPLEKLAVALTWILRLGAYQLSYLEKVPAHSAVDESVKLARRFGHAGTAAVANAVLRKIARQRIAPPRPTPADPIATFADYVSVPDWLAEHFVTRFGFETALRACEGANALPRRAVRVNTRILPVDEATKALERAGVMTRPSRYGIAECLVLESIPAPAAPVVQRMIRSGRLTMQSEESQLAVQLLDPKPGDVILDACAGRGVKTGGLGLRSPSRIFAVDDDPDKLAVLQQDMVRLGEEKVEALVADAMKPYEIAFSPDVDAALVDAPCTAVGTLGRRADVRWAKKPEDAPRLAIVQRAILARAAEHVRAGGHLLYVTCSTDAREDEQVVDEFLRENAGWAASDTALDAPEGTFVRLGRYVLTIPGIDGADGFFFALLKRM